MDTLIYFLLKNSLKLLTRSPTDIKCAITYIMYFLIYIVPEYGLTANKSI